MKIRKSQSPFQASTINGRRAFQASILTAAALSLLSIGLTARAQVISGQENGSFGTLLRQTDSLLYPNNGCVPTAVAQGLSYLENYDPSAFPTTSPNNITAVNALGAAMGTTDASGTTYPGRVIGTTSYLSANHDNAYVVGGQYSSYYSAATSIGPTVQSSMAANSTASFLAGALNANDGVEFALLWGTLTGGSYAKGNGGHFVTLESISYDTAAGTGSIKFIDPGDGASWDGTLTKITGGSYVGDLYVTYTQFTPTDDGEDHEEDVAGAWLDGGTPDTGGVIINDLAEAVPDSALTAALLSGSLLGLAALRRRYC